MTAEASCQANGTPVFDRLELWSSVTVKKTTAGRGSNGEMSPYGLQKLRELILELAVRGMLVPQHPNEEPVSDLLEKVDKEREELVQDGVFRKQTTLPNIERGEIPFDVPEGWRWVRIGRLGRIFNGNSISVRVKEEKYTNIEGGLPFIATKDIGYGWQVIAYENGISIPRDEPNFKVAHKGAVLICAEGGSAGKKCGITKQDICFGNKLFAVELLGNVVPNYLLVNFLSPMFFEQFTANMTGIIGGISLAKLKNLLIPLPPLAEQSRIVAKVDELMALCDELEQQQTDSLQAHQTLVETLLRTLVGAGDAESTQQAWARIAEHFDTLFTTEESIEQLKQAILQLAVMGRLVHQDPNDEPASALLEKIAKENERLGKKNSSKLQSCLRNIADDEKPFELPPGWEWQRLGDLGEIQGGGTPSKTNSHYWDGPIHWVTPKDMKVDFIAEAQQTITLKAVEETTVKIIPEQSLLMVVRGMILSHSFPVSINTKPVTVNQDMKAVSFLHHDPQFILLMMKGLKQNIVGLVERSSHGTCKLVSGKLWNRLLGIPPLVEQRRIVAKVDELMALCDSLKTQIQDAQVTQVHLADAFVQQAVA